MAGEGTKRIIELPEATTVSSGDYFAIDSENGGTKKLSQSALPSKSELLDIRVGANGYTYPSAGDAVRDQLGDVCDVLPKVSGQSVYSAISNEYVDANGAFQSYNGWFRSAYIEVTPYTQIRIINSGIRTGYNALYDNEHNFIKRFDIENGENYIKTDRAKYIAISQTKADYQKIKVFADVKASLLEQSAISETKLDKVFAFPKNLLNLSKGNIANAYVDSTGEIVYYNGWHAIETYIPIRPNTGYIAKYYNGAEWSSNAVPYYALYDNKKVFTKAGFIANGEYLVTSNNDAFIRLSFANSINDGHVMFGTIEDLSDLEPTLSAYIDPNIVLKNVIPDDVRIVMPDKCVAVVGSEFNIYHENVVVCNNHNDYSYDWLITPYTLTYDVYEDCLRFTPAATGEYTIRFRVRRRSDLSVVAEKKISLTVVENKTITNKTVLFLGDSLTNAGYYPYEIQHNLANDGIVSVGTQESKPWFNGVRVDINHEGRGGWSPMDYTGLSEKQGVVNSFWNPNTNKFDFGYWLTNNGYSLPDICFINLGTNGVAQPNEVINSIDEIISSIRAISQTVPIAISLITPPATQNGWTYANHGGSATEFSYNQMRLNTQYLSAYGNRENEHIYLSPVYFNLDRYRDYNTAEFAVSSRNPEKVVMQTNNVHPSVYGYYKFADVYWAMIQYILG